MIITCFITAYNLDHSETFIEAGRKYKKAGGEETTYSAKWFLHSAAMTSG